MTQPKRTNILKGLLKWPSNDTSTSTEEMDFTERLLLDYYVLFVQNHPDLILVLSLDGKIVSDNKRDLNKLLGYRFRQNVSYKDLMSKEQCKRLTSAFNSAKGGKSERVQFEMLNKKNEYLHLMATFIPIESPSKHIEAVSVIVKDITAKKVLEREKLLKKSHVEQVQEIARIGSWEYYISTGQIKCSKSCYKIVGLRQMANPSKKTLLSTVHPKDREKLSTLLNKATSEGTSFSTDFRIYHRQTKELRYVKIKVEVETETHKPVKLIGVLKDFTEQKNLEIELRETNKDYRHIFDNLHAGFWSWDVGKKQLVFASKGLSNILQKPLEILYDESNFWKNMILPKHRDQFIEKNRLLNKGEPIEQYYQIKAGDGTVKWVHEQTIPRVDESGKVVQLFGRIIDINHEIEMKNKLEFLTKYDTTTSLPNHYSLREKMDELVNDHSIDNFVLLYIELDNFHGIINYLGHHIGDKVLKQIANRLRSLCPKNSFLAKENNDAYVLVIYNYPDKTTVIDLVKSIMEDISKSLKVEKYKFYVTASMGVSFYPDNGADKLTLLESAHAALSHAKSLGKNNYQIYSFDRDISAHKKYMLEKDLHQAIEHEEFEVYYQPQVNSKTNAIVGAEALIRWNHKEWGLVSPGEFIPIAEEKHLIGIIGDWVIRNVCERLYIWRKQGLPICPISINISPIRFLKPGVVETVKKILDRYEIPAELIILEVTESSLLQNDAYILETLRALKDLGVKIALDDFGTGYATFHYLQSFDVDIIKIDQSFIQNLFSDKEKEPKEAAIVSSFLHLAQLLKIDVVAEGVEEYEQLQFLSQKQCNIIQGYIYSKPVGIEEFEKLIKMRYLRPNKQSRNDKRMEERREYFRFTFPFHLSAKMYITKIGEKKVNVGAANILIENISLGGIRFLSTLNLPIVAKMK